MFKFLKSLILIIFLFNFIILVNNANGVIIDAVNCTQSAVQDAINSASNGDIVQIPNGSSNWTTPVTITDKAITLKGNGSYSVDSNHEDTGSWPLIITLSGNNGLEVSGNPEQNIRITGIHFTGTTGFGTSGYGAIKILRTNETADWRIDNCRFSVSGNAVAVLTSGLGGLIDHIYSYDSGCASAGAVLVMDLRNNSYGDWAFTQPVSFGSANFTFVEDSTFWKNGCTTSAASCLVMDSQCAGKMVFRNNYVRDAMAVWHGSETGTPQRGGYAFEIYNNEFYWHIPNNKYHCTVYARGGTLLLYNNTITNYGVALRTWVHRVEEPHGRFGQCDGDTPCDGNWGGSYPVGYPCLDQVGRGKATGIWGTNGEAVQPQEESPCYIWNNIRNNTGTVYHNQPEHVVSGRDYYFCDDDSCAPDGYQPFPYPHFLIEHDTSPIRSNGSPTGTLPLETTQTTLSLTTNENASCRYSTTAGTPYSSMTNTFSITGETNHSTISTGLTEGNTYNYYVRCQNTEENVNTTDYAISFSIASPPDTTPPTIPTNLTANAVSSAQNNLSWTASTDNIGVTGYTIYRCTGSGCTSTTQIATTPTNSYSDTGLSGNTTYTYQVSAYDSAGNNSSPSSSVSTTTLAVTNANNYYVRDNNCSDNNNGSESSPWCHCPGMAGWSGSTTLRPGDTVYFDSAGTWTVASGSYLLNITGGVTYIGDSWGSGTRAQFRAASPLSSSIVQWYDDDSTIVTELQGFEINANHQVTNGIGMNFPGWSYENSPLTGATKRIQNCVVHDVYSEQSRGEYKYGIIVSNWGGDSTVVRNVEIIDNVCYNMSRTCYNLYPAAYGSSYGVGNVLIRGNECYATAQDPGYYAGSGLIIKNNVYDVVAEFNHFHDISGMWSTGMNINSDYDNSTGPTNIIVRYNILRNTGCDAIHIRNHSDKDIEIYGNIIQPENGCSAIKVDGSTDDGLNLLIYNNTIYEGAILIDSNPARNVTALEIKNNIFYRTSGTLITDNPGEITSHNNNIYYSGTGGSLVYSNGTNYTSSNLSSYESTALSDNPLFVNTSNLPTGFTGDYGINKQPNTNGLSLVTDSCAINTGANLGNPYNNSINSISKPYGIGWERGAYEIGSTLSAPSNLHIFNITE